MHSLITLMQFYSKQWLTLITFFFRPTTRYETSTWGDSWNGSIVRRRTLQQKSSLTKHFLFILIRRGIRDTPHDSPDAELDSDESGASADEIQEQASDMHDFNSDESFSTSHKYDSTE